MTEHRERIEKALHECAEHRVPDTADPWPGIRTRLGPETSPRRSSRARFMPRTRAGWAFAALVILLCTMGAYAASGLLYVTFQDELPAGDAVDLGQKLDLVQTADGARVTLQWVYADEKSVVAGVSIQDLQENRRAAGYPAELQPAYPNKLLHESDARFHESDGQYYGSEDESPMGDVPVSIVFSTDDGIEPGANHRFRLDVPVAARPLVPKGTDVKPPGVSGEGVPYQVPLGEPFVFDFEIPVHPAPTVMVDQQAEASGVTLTLKQVVASPARPGAVICYGSPDIRYDWTLWGERDLFFGGGPQIGDEHACTSVVLPYQLEGNSTVRVERLEGIPDCPPGDENGCTIPRNEEKKIQGPWAFEFEVPRR